MRILILFLLTAFSNVALSCSCESISSIDEAIKNNPILVEVRVISFDERTHPTYGVQRFSAALDVLKTYKGKATPKKITIDFGMCYTSLVLENMAVGRRYILPLEQSGKFYFMPECSHSGLELKDGQLYTHELILGQIKRKLKLYQSYSAFIRARST
jgi:hypothetical protein